MEKTDLNKENIKNYDECVHIFVYENVCRVLNYDFKFDL